MGCSFDSILLKGSNVQRREHNLMLRLLIRFSFNLKIFSLSTSIANLNEPNRSHTIFLIHSNIEWRILRGCLLPSFKWPWLSFVLVLLADKITGGLEICNFRKFIFYCLKSSASQTHTKVRAKYFVQKGTCSFLRLCIYCVSSISYPCPPSFHLITFKGPTSFIYRLHFSG